MSFPGHLGQYALEPPPQVQAAARSWKFAHVSRETEPGHHYPELRQAVTVTQAHLACSLCGQSVYCLSPDMAGDGYMTDLDGIQAGITRHILQCHRGVVIPDDGPRV